MTNDSELNPEAAQDALLAGTYILTPDRIAVPAATLEWAYWREGEFRKPGGGLARVGHTPIPGLCHVSTVFLGLDHGHGFLMGANPTNAIGEYRPVLFETMVFGHKQRIKWPGGGRRTIRPDWGMWRYCTWAEAEAGHKAVCAVYRRHARELAQLYAAGRKKELERLRGHLHALVRGA